MNETNLLSHCGMVKNLEFKPLPGFSSPHLQMIFAFILPPGIAPHSKKELIDLGEGDSLCCVVSKPKHWKETDQTIVLIHGLGGSSSSPYMIRMARKLYREGHKIVRVNLRGAGLGRGLSKIPYHAGTSEDLFKILQHLKKEHPKSAIRVIGFSLGGNVALKLAGELGEEAKKWVKTFIAVCAPIDLGQTLTNMLKQGNRVYNYYFLKQIHWQAKSWKQENCRNLAEFDELVTAPLWGFKGASEYYQKCSSWQFIPRIRQTTHLLFAKDDPFIEFDKINEISLPKEVQVWVTEKGSHVGFLGKAKQSIFWMDQLLMDWVKEEK